MGSLAKNMKFPQTTQESKTILGMFNELTKLEPYLNNINL